MFGSAVQQFLQLVSEAFSPPYLSPLTILALLPIMSEGKDKTTMTLINDNIN